MVIFGSALFWALFSSAVSLIFIIAVVRRRMTDRLLDEPLSPAQGQALHSAQIDVLKELLADTGYAYDWRQNIFYSVMNPWQRKFGYCRLYDESAAALWMVIDCEPVYFDYGGKKWMIELWKGQYGITIGGEIGIYNTTGPDLTIPGVFNGTFYHCAGDEDTLSMTYTLIREGTVLFKRTERHWWLTGFMPGEFAKPKTLTMLASITFKDHDMLSAFLGGLKKLDYTQDQYHYSGNTVLILFKKPHSMQPLTRRGLIAWFALREDRRNVLKYRRLTRGATNILDALSVLQDKAPFLYKRALDVGRPKEVYKPHETIRPYLEQQ